MYLFSTHPIKPWRTNCPISKDASRGVSLVARSYKKAALVWFDVADVPYVAPTVGDEGLVPESAGAPPIILTLWRRFWCLASRPCTTRTPGLLAWISATKQTKTQISCCKTLFTKPRYCGIKHLYMLTFHWCFDKKPATIHGERNALNTGPRLNDVI